MVEKIVSCIVPFEAIEEPSTIVRIMPEEKSEKLEELWDKFLEIQIAINEAIHFLPPPPTDSD